MLKHDAEEASLCLKGLKRWNWQEKMSSRGSKSLPKRVKKIELARENEFVEGQVSA